MQHHTSHLFNTPFVPLPLCLVYNYASLPHQPTLWTINFNILAEDLFSAMDNPR
jgi:hypothetical protein